jgi:ubiquinone/menaquinone biosynthesis C-methylase UbiE
VYEAEFAEIYDIIHQHRGKDYAAEVIEIARLVRQRKPDADSVLDVACGTGGHLRFLAESFGRAEGLELSADMLAVAKTRVPAIRLHQGDMRDFRLNGRFDAITCMFSSIGYLRSTVDLDRTLACLARHLTPGGVLAIEPWVFPDTFLPGYVASDMARMNGRTVVRVSHSVREDDATRMRVHYLDADATGIRELTDTHLLSLFTRTDYETAFARAGCTAKLLDATPVPRGLYVGVLKEES